MQEELIEYDLANAEYINRRSFGATFLVAPGIVAKVGIITQDEVHDQQYAARQGLALPVLDYYPLPEEDFPLVSSWLPPRAFLSHEYYSPVHVLVMPAATPLSVREQSIYADEINELARILWDELLIEHDSDNPENYAFWEGRLIALDFG